MPKIDFSTIDDVNDFSPLPEGEYLCRLTDIEETTTRQDDDQWKLRFVVEAGEYSGRYIFDNLFFSPKALPRVKLICSRLGVDVAGELDLRPEHLIDKSCRVKVIVAEYQNEEGNTKLRNKVPYAGYESANGEDDSEDNVPF